MRARIMHQLVMATSTWIVLGSSSQSSYHFDAVQGYWSPGEWGSCLLFNTSSGLPSGSRSGCGFGSQTRPVRCIEFPSWPPVVKDDRFCASLPKPDQERLCAVRCSPDCNLGPWSTWSKCSCTCREKCRSSQSVRVRRVIDPPDEGISCPHLVEKRSCISLSPSLPSCYEHQTVDNHQPVVLPLADLERGHHHQYSQLQPRRTQSLEDSLRDLHLPTSEPIVYIGPWSSCQVSSVGGSTVVQSAVFAGSADSEVKRRAVRENGFPERNGMWREKSQKSGTLESQAGRQFMHPEGVQFPLPPPSSFGSSGLDPMHSVPTDPPFLAADLSFPVAIDARPGQPASGASASSSVKGLLTSKPPRLGTRRRDVVCRGKGGETRQFKQCMDGSRSTVVPSDRQLCVVPQDCKVGEWSPWSLSENSVDFCRWSPENIVREERRRDIVELGVGEGALCPHLVETRPANMTTATCKLRYHWNIGPWSPCKVLKASSSSTSLGFNSSEAASDLADAEERPCGGGVRHRNLTCMDRESGTPVAAQLCLDRDKDQTFATVMMERCEVACSGDCLVSDWSPWSPCQPDSCLNSQHTTIRGFQLRTREMIGGDLKGKRGHQGLGDDAGADYQQDPGLSCPPLQEVRSCSLESCHKWLMEPTGSCELAPANPATCGSGSQYQVVTCVRWDGQPAADPAACDPLPRPRSRVECHVPCPEDCIVSSWSEWSGCPVVGCDGGAHGQARPRLPLQHRNRTVLALAGRDGQACPPSEDLTEMSSCGDLRSACDQVSWEPQPWEECQLAPGLTCGSGLQTRKVFCVDVNGSRLPTWRCSRLKTRIRRRLCKVPCPRDCLLSQWTAWSPCPDRCAALTGGSDSSASGGILLMETQRRARVILEAAEHGGAACAALAEVRPCPLLAASCGSPRWHPDPWSGCSLPAGMTCGEGMRSRAVKCLQAGSAVPLQVCLSRVDAGPVPARSEACHVDCSDSCSLSAWSPWSACPPACGSVRTRVRSPIDGTACTSMTLESKQSEICPCNKFTARPNGPWSACILEDDSSGNDILLNPNQPPICGEGKRYRRMDCHDARGNLVENSWCGGGDYLVEKCEIPCPQDCIISPWRGWGLCDSICGAGLKNRTANVLIMAENGGRPCPGPTVQYSACHYSCQNLVWSPGPWSECRLYSGSCGVGTRKRSLRCVEQLGESQIVVADSFCDPLTRPEAESDCQEPCPGQCVLGEWSTWTECADCSWGSRRSRVRRILRQPDTNSIVCPPTEETTSCILNTTCWTYRWELTGWSSCELGGVWHDEGTHLNRLSWRSHSTCGSGVMTRGIRCVRSDGRPVDRERCSRLSPPEGDLKLSCTVDCPLDCYLSPWSPWDSSQCSCGPNTANITRKRQVLVNPSPTGRPCPTNLIEEKPCPSRPCYSWYRSPWSECQLQGATCGTGVLRRNISCVTKPGGITVPDTFCKDKSTLDPVTGLIDGGLVDFSTEASCYVSCDSDCTVSSWTDWSTCSPKSCRPHNSIGVEERTRSIVQSARGSYGKCPPTLSEKRWCISPPCYKYQWVVSNGDVFCQRSDGARVQSGCESSVVGCGPSCWSVQHATCLSGHCVCRPGYLPQFSAHPSPRLTACLQTSLNVSSQGLGVRDENVYHYYPEGRLLSYWMFALISIGCIFIAFLGISIYILCKSTCKPEYDRNPVPNNRILIKRQETPLPPLWQ